MGHLNHPKAYLKLRKRLDSTQVRLPPSREIYEILKILFTEEEARIVAAMPLKPSTVSKIAGILGEEERRVEKILEGMADKGLIFDLFDERRGEKIYAIAPPVVGFFEFSLMRVRRDIDQKRLATLFQQYLMEDGTFTRALFSGDTQIGRTLIYTDTIDREDCTRILPYEDAGALVAESEGGALGICFCRHESLHTGKECRFPLEICMSINGGADFVLRHNFGHRADTMELLDIIQASKEMGLVQICDNVKRRPSFLCQCCSCCCGMLMAVNRLGLTQAVMTSNFIASVDTESCAGCSRCMRRCPVQAITLRALPPQAGSKQGCHAVVDEEICLGCGICTLACNRGGIKMEKREARVLTPENTLERILRMTLERGNIHHLIYDEVEGRGYAFMNRLAKAILLLPPVKGYLLQEKVKSRFIASILRRAGEDGGDFIEKI